MLTVGFPSGRWYDTRLIVRFSVETAIVTGNSVKDKTRYHAQLSQYPARHAGCALEVGPDEWRAPGFYQLLTALVVPRPVDFDDLEERSAHLAPYFYFNLMARRIRLDRR